MDFGDAGIMDETFGENNQFKRRMLIPWKCDIDTEKHLLPLLDSLFHQFLLLESCSMGGPHHATIINEKKGEHFEIEIYPKYILVYPKEKDHQLASERLFKIFERYGGKLDINIRRE